MELFFNTKKVTQKYNLVHYLAIIATFTIIIQDISHGAISNIPLDQKTS